MISNGKVRKRTGLSRHFYSDTSNTKPIAKQSYDPTLHFWLLGFICVVIIIIILITLLYAPKRPEHSQLGKVLDTYLSGTKIYEIDFDQPQEFIQHVINNNLQQGINKFYGNQHSLIIENNGWKLIIEGNKLNKPGLVCEKIGCLITIKLINVLNKFNKNINKLYIAISYSITNQENTMGIAQIWIDTNEKVKFTREGKILDAYDQDTKAVTKLLDWRINTVDFVPNDELYFHAMVMDHESHSRDYNKFKILGFALYFK